MKGKLTVAGLIMLIGGAITFLVSFLDFLGETSAWGEGLLPIATIPALLGLAMAVEQGLRLGGVALPEPVLTFSWKQIRFTWGVVAVTIMLAWLIVDKGFADTGAGLMLMLIGSIAMVVGATLDLLGKGNAVIGAPKAASPGAAPPPPPPPPSAPPPPPA
jgi:hypothetical protein